jgi:hypothetical protein
MPAESKPSVQVKKPAARGLAPADLSGQETSAQAWHLPLFVPVRFFSGTNTHP